MYLGDSCYKYTISSRSWALYTKLTIPASLEDINTKLFMYFLITSRRIMFQSLVYKRQLELALQLGNTQQHSSQRAFLGFSSEGVLVHGWVWVCLCLLSFCLDTVKAKLVLIFHKCYWNHHKSCKVHSMSHMSTSLKVCVFSVCNVISSREIATFFLSFFFLFYFFCLPFFFSPSVETKQSSWQGTLHLQPSSFSFVRCDVTTWHWESHCLAETPINGLSVLLIYMLRNGMGIACCGDSHFPFS